MLYYSVYEIWEAISRRYSETAQEMLRAQPDESHFKGEKWETSEKEKEQWKEKQIYEIDERKREWRKERMEKNKEVERKKKEMNK